MIEYELKDIDNNVFPLNGEAVTVSFKETWKPGNDDFKFSTKIVERSFLPGSSAVGETRLESREYTLSVNWSNPDMATFRDHLNPLISFISRTRFIVDVTNDMELEVIALGASTAYDAGGEKLSSDNSFTFIAISPCWQNLSADNVAGEATADIIAAIAVDNQGVLPVYPVITIVATIPTDDIQIYIDSDNTGIQILDSAFGSPGNLTMIINCETGIVSINDLNRNTSIVQGTGFFPLPVGSDTVNILSSETVNYTIEWFKRYYI